MISAASVAPNFLLRRSIVTDELKRLDEPAVIFEHEGVDDDGVTFYVYTVAGWLDGENVATIQGGATVGGDVIVIHAESREAADAMAGLGLQDTIEALKVENERYIDALVAKERLAGIGPLERMAQALKPDADKSDLFVSDVDKLRPLVGDDIVLAAGGVKH